MTDVPVERLMSTDLVTVSVEATAAEAATLMLETGVNSILIVDGAGRLEGLLTGTDFVTLVRENDPEDETPVGTCMTADVVTASRTDSVDALSALADGEYTHIPVTDDERVVVGMLSTTDLTRHLAERR
ncbi:CBS domain-containing protein [Halorubrum alkaliphilum]|uniref:CBS domain-containing protein n=1 Tax=Halorubrum alkaliphilum TaxID=261290 RepID=A0A8T4GC36_9EURY|nr:CBS domain-containing protein [Halorubrum alkaliphilum]MBP1921299.1 CBS domain-containing protein [Halorubrum alkaliphilum]